MGTKPTGATRRDWRSEIVDLEMNLQNMRAERNRARSLARIMYHILAQQPTSIDEYDDNLSLENLPDWIFNPPKVRNND